MTRMDCAEFSAGKLKTDRKGQFMFAPVKPQNLLMYNSAMQDMITLQVDLNITYAY